MTAHRPPRRVFALALFAFAALGFLASACTGISSPEGWASPVLVPSDVPGQEDLLLASHRDRLYALDADTLNQRWVFPPDGNDDDDIDVSALYGTPAVTDSNVYVPSYDTDRKGTLYALDRETGAVDWAAQTDGPLVGDVTIANGVVYFGSSDGYVYALDAESGQPYWRPPAERFDTGDSVWSAPVVVGDTLYVTSLDRHLYALEAETGREIWSFETDAGVASPPVVDEEAGLVYVGGFDSRLRAVDVEERSQRWEFRARNWFWTRPLVSDGVVYAGSLDHRVYALDAGSGDAQWREPFETRAPVRAAPVLVNGTLIVIDKDGNVYAIDPADGSLAIDRPERLVAEVLADPLLRPGADGESEELIVATTGGELVRIDPSTLRVIERRELGGE